MIREFFPVMREFFFTVVFIASCAVCSAREPVGTLRWPDSYPLDFPTAKKFCPPIRSTFFEVTQRFGVVRGKRFRQQLNGGYGLPIVDKVNGKNLIHVGADLGWYQVGEPVFAVAAGVVRLSVGAAEDDDAPTAEDRASALALRWGNLVVIEHRLADAGSFVTTVYGHLGTNRLVKPGDIVEAGQAIGTIGKKHPNINGGYEPHLHFGVRNGRMAETGMQLFELLIGGKRHSVTVTSLGEEEIQVDMPASVPDGFSGPLAGRRHAVVKRDGKYFLPAGVLWGILRPDFAIVGYDLTKKEWRDPVAFLREHRADRDPAPFQPATPARVR